MDAETLKREFDRDLILKDGGSVRLRPIVPEDEAGLMTPRATESAERLPAVLHDHAALVVQVGHHLANVDRRRRLALVAVDPQTGDLVGVARNEPTAEPATAEVAFVVQDSWQNRGLGTRLFGELLRAAALNGIGRFHAWVLADNRRMLDMIGRFGVVVGRTVDQDLVDVVFEAPASVHAIQR